MVESACGGSISVGVGGGLDVKIGYQWDKGMTWCVDIFLDCGSCVQVKLIIKEVWLMIE